MAKPAKEVKTHDFRRTDLIERVELQALEGLLETFTRSTTQKLSSMLRHTCNFELTQLDQMTWNDLTQELESGFHFFTFALPPLIGHALLAIPTEDALALVDLRLAGTGEDDFTGLVPTEMDRAFFAPIIEDVLLELSRAMARIRTTKPVLETQEASVQFVTVATPVEMCLVVRFSLTVASRPTHEALICLPFAMVRMLLDDLHTGNMLGDDGEVGSPTLAARHRLLEVPLEIVFQFPSFVTTPAQLLTLRVGDSLGLGHPKGRPLEVRAEGLLIALAEMCSSGVHKACQIKEEVTK